MAAPAVLSYGPPAADFHRIVGPTAAAAAAVAMAQATRSLRWVNLLLGWTIIGWIIALVMSIREHRIIGIR
ncbi:MAG: superinfection immunity protein [Actinobacteria bacterium]|nr:superinfection immunity protein [Actinomycetota bacterium]